MKTKNLFWIIPLIVIMGLALLPMISCSIEEEETEGKSPELLKQALFDYYDGIKNKDFDKMMGATTADFITFVDGCIFRTKLTPYSGEIDPSFR